MRNIILSHFPKTYNTYIEPFGGSGTILFGKKETPLEVYNDIGQNVYSLFKVLSDKNLFNQLKYKLDLTYYSNDIRSESIKKLKQKNLSLLERAYCFFVINRMSYNGVGGFSTTLLKRRNMSKSVSDFLSSIDRLPEVHNRLSNLIVENRDIIDIIDKYDAINNFMYLDPPYVHSTRKSSTAYENEMTDKDHEILVDKVLNSKSKFLISGYNHQIYDILTNLTKWNKKSFKSPNALSNSIETLWWNYDLNSKQNISNIFE
jgi:DNA adenine methylase